MAFRSEQIRNCSPNQDKCGIEETDAGNAETFCTSLGSHLVEIFNQDQQDFIKQKADLIGKAEWNGGYWWIGLKRGHFSSTWKWIYSNQPPNYTTWANGKPYWNGDCTKFLIFFLQWKKSPLTIGQNFENTKFQTKSLGI